MRIAVHSFLYKRLNDKKFVFNYKDFFIQCLIKRGLKSKAKLIFSTFLKLLKNKFLLNKTSSINDFLKNHFDKKKPCVGFIARKVASVVYTIPVYIRPDRARAVIIRWFVANAILRTEKSISKRLFFEFLDFSTGVGRTIRKLEDYYKVAIKNRPFTKFKRKRSRKYISFRRRKYGI